LAVTPTVQFYQLTEDGKKNEKTAMKSGQSFNEENLTAQQLIYWATYELVLMYRMFTRLRIKTYSLRKPIFLDVDCQGKDYQFVCQRILRSEFAKLKKSDKPFRLKNTLFLVQPIAHLRKAGTKSAQTENITDLYPILNAIERELGAEVRKFSPVIYTGMTN
jgi:hypothetical protein